MWLKKAAQAVAEPIKRAAGFFTASSNTRDLPTAEQRRNDALALAFKYSAEQFIRRGGSGVGMDSVTASEMKAASFNDANAMSPDVLAWYAAHSFIGYAACALLAQHWLVDKACSMPGEDATRNGYNLTINGGQNVAPDVLESLKNDSKAMGLDQHLLDFSRNCRVFGVRIAIFDIAGYTDKDYERPFNIDGVKPGSYRGIIQVDPQWIMPELDLASSGDPTSPDFYEPTWWRVGGRRYHKSHLVVIRYRKVSKMLLPSYMFGGLPLTQLIYERVYASERTADEVPRLAMTKRTKVYKVSDLENAMANLNALGDKLELMTILQDNHALRLIGMDEDMTQLDTSLADLDDVLMSTFQLVCAISGVPATKMLGTSPKGFNSNGDGEARNYTQMLETVQTHELTPVADRHYLLLCKSQQRDFTVTIGWNKTDSPTAQETGDLNKVKAETDQLLVQSGAIDAQEVRERVIADPTSGYNGLPTYNDDVGDNFDTGENDGGSEDQTPPASGDASEQNPREAAELQRSE